MNKDLPASEQRSFGGLSALIKRPLSGPQISGTIRPGIQVLTAKAASQGQAKRLYELGCQKGLSFDAIAKTITDQVPGLEHPLRPVNVPYFTARSGDFSMPDAAARLNDLYGEDRGEGKHLYRFPVVFCTDQIEQVLSYKLQCWASGKLKYWAEFGPNGERRCMTYAPVPKHGNSKRPVRLFGGRSVITRPGNGGLCDPLNCPEYQSKNCNQDGRIHFIVPGVPSLGQFCVPTRSFYSISAIAGTLAHVAEMSGGRIAGFLNQQKTFWLSKVYKDVTRIDDQGEPVNGPAWLISLDGDLDMSQLLLQKTQQAALPAADRAVQMLSAPAPDDSLLVPMALAHEVNQIGAAQMPHAGEAPTTGAVPSNDAGNLTEAELLKGLRHELMELVEQLGIDNEVFRDVAVGQFGGADWAKAIKTLQPAMEILKKIREPFVAMSKRLGEYGISFDEYNAYAQLRFRRIDWWLIPEQLTAGLEELADYRDEPEKLHEIIQAEVEHA